MLDLVPAVSFLCSLGLIAWEGLSRVIAAGVEVDVVTQGDGVKVVKPVVSALGRGRLVEGTRDHLPPRRVGLRSLSRFEHGKDVAVQVGGAERVPLCVRSREGARSAIEINRYSFASGQFRA